MRYQTSFEIPVQHGKTVVITGANSGIGYEAARVLAAKGAHVILAVRSVERGEQAAAALRQSIPAADIAVMELDLAHLESVSRFVDTLRSRHSTIPLLINNAGVMALPFRQTRDGFEMQFGTNHLGHFALTGLLLPALLAAPAARIVTVSSTANNFGRIDFDNLDGLRGYSRWGAYGQSKLANLLFTYELQRRLERAGASTISVACHPGFAATNLQFAGPRMDGSRLMHAVLSAANSIAQTAADGALSTLHAATAPDVRGGEFFGPRGLLEIRGVPGKTRSSPRSYDAQTAQRLWDVSVELTGVEYAALRG